MCSIPGATAQFFVARRLERCTHVLRQEAGFNSPIGRILRALVAELQVQDLLSEEPVNGTAPSSTDGWRPLSQRWRT